MEITVRKFVFTLALPILSSSFWLFCGIYSDPEFGGLHLFLKHRPSPVFYFCSPFGESDRLPSTEAEQRKELNFHEFVELHDGDRRSVTILP